MRDFRKLKVWEKSHALTVQVYQAITKFPAAEKYGLTAQIRRCCTSIPANIAEGCGRESDANFGRFLQIALGSACELEYHLLLSHDLHLIEDSQYSSLQTQVVEVKQMLYSLLKKLRADGQADACDLRAAFSGTARPAARMGHFFRAQSRKKPSTYAVDFCRFVAGNSPHRDGLNAS
ncbi:MAG: four helix bundle protein [Acidobacteriota bacterium]